MGYGSYRGTNEPKPWLFAHLDIHFLI